MALLLKADRGRSDLKIGTLSAILFDSTFQQQKELLCGYQGGCLASLDERDP